MYWGVCPIFILKEMKIEEIENAINPAVESHGCILWGIDLLRGKKRPIIRIFIDAIAGATINDCEKVAKDLNYELAIHNAFVDQDYILEVSTPGIDRKFFKVDQLDSYINKEFNLKLRASIRGKKTLTAKLTNITNDLVCFQSGDEEINLNFFDLDQCRLKPDFKEIMRINNGKY